jgi:hypothetical protein
VAERVAFRLRQQLEHMRWWVAVGLVGLAGCSSPEEKAGRALHQEQGWAAAAEAITSDRLVAALPAHFVARTLGTAARAAEAHARTIDAVRDLADDERRSSTDAVRQLATTLEASASSVHGGQLDAAHKAALLEAYAGVMARARSLPH